MTRGTPESDGRAHAAAPERPAVTWWEIAFRAAIALVLLATVDAAVARARPLPEPAEAAAPYRLPESGELPDLVRLAQSTGADPDNRRVVFLGSSPAWGYGVTDPSDTVPSVFSRHTAADGDRLLVYNLASRGQMADDFTVLAHSIGGRADIYVVQLTYTLLDPGARAERPARFPELADALGVSVDGTLAVELGVSPAPALDLDPPLDREVRRVSALYRERYALLSPGGQRIEDAAFRRFAKRFRSWAAPAPALDETPPKSDPFDLQEPADQLIAVDRYRGVANLWLHPRNPELRRLAALAAYFDEQGIPAVFYLSPVNEEALDFNGPEDWARYDRNVARVRHSVEGSGGILLDYGRGHGLPQGAFVDITHLTGEGSRVFGERLYSDVASAAPGVLRP
ncbi:MAG: hypothetical protein C0418_05040 [Coriobacteriaceae bacterium]|nr:hypothetical protein [Coriobacteriaceae bacterium]